MIHLHKVHARNLERTRRKDENLKRREQKQNKFETVTPATNPFSV